MATLARWDPFRDLLSMQGELNRLFGRTYAEDGGTSWIPALDVFETEEKFVVTLELAGMEPEEVEVSVEDSTLTVSGERKFSEEVSEDNYRRVERRYGSFSRSLTLPQTADAEHVDASFDKGVLRIEVPKIEAPKPKKIEVKATS